MDSRLYFVLGDLGSNVLIGLVVGWLSALLVGVGWNMYLAMVVTMVLGMVVGTILWFPLGIFFGAMELMLPAMLTGMASGMVVGMWAAMVPLGPNEAATIGAVCGLSSIVLVWIINNSMRGVRHYPAEA
jgi:hypothetical protein